MPPSTQVQPSFQVLVLDPVAGAVQAVFDTTTFYDLRYSRLVNDVGKFTLTLPYSNANRMAFALDSFVEIYRTSPLTGQLILEDTYFARSFNRYRQGDLEQYVVSGPHLNDLIQRRIVDPNDDPSAAGGYSTAAGASDTVLYHYAYYNMGPGASLARQFPGLSIAVPPGVGLGVGYRLRFDDMLKTLFQDAAARGGTDFNIQRTTGAAMQLSLAIMGTDRRKSSHYPVGGWVGLDPKRGNLEDPNLIIDRTKEKTFVYALGQGQDINRQLLKVPGMTTTDSPFNRIEYQDTSSNVQKGDITGLTTAAYASLKKNAFTQSFAFKLLEATAGNTYQSDWFLGDLVTVSYDEYSSDLRITGVELFINEQGQTVTPTAVTI